MAPMWKREVRCAQRRWAIAKHQTRRAICRENCPGGPLNRPPYALNAHPDDRRGWPGGTFEAKVKVETALARLQGQGAVDGP